VRVRVRVQVVYFGNAYGNDDENSGRTQFVRPRTAETDDFYFDNRDGVIVLRYWENGGSGRRSQCVYVYAVAARTTFGY